MKIAIGNDHTATALKWVIVREIEALGHEVTNFGTDTDERIDYPIPAKRIADAVASGACDRGVLICGTGIGISLAANKVKGIRAAVCSETYSARLTRSHNDANIIAFGARVVGEEVAKEIVRVFLATEYEGGRHQARLDQISKIERGEL